MAAKNKTNKQSSVRKKNVSQNGKLAIDPDATTLTALEKDIKKVSSEDEVEVLMSIVDILENFHDIVQEKLRQVLRDREGNEINPDGKISFEPVSKKAKDKEYVYTRASWKEGGVKKGKSLPQIEKKIVQR